MIVQASLTGSRGSPVAPAVHQGTGILEIDLHVEQGYVLIPTYSQLEIFLKVEQIDQVKLCKLDGKELSLVSDMVFLLPGNEKPVSTDQAY